MAEKIVLVGGGGHAKVVISVIREIGDFEIVGISDLPQNLGRVILGVPVKFTDDELPELLKKGVKYAFISLGHLGRAQVRQKLFEFLKSIGFEFPTLISKHAVVSPHVTVGEGTLVMPGAVVNADAKIGRNVILNTSSVVEHDCVVDDNVHIAPRAVLGGGVKVGKGTLIGMGAVVIQGITIGEDVIVGAGAVVVKDIPSGAVAKGIPARW